MTINSSIGVDHHHHHQQHQHHHHHHSHDHHQHNCQSNQHTDDKGVQVEQDARPTANLNDDDDEKKDQHHLHQHHQHQQLHQCNKKIKKKDIVRCSTPPIESVLVGLVGTAQKTSTLVNGDGVLGGGDEGGKTSPLLMPPKPIQRRSKQQSRPNSEVVQQNSDAKPVDVNNNKSSKQQQQQQSKVAIIRQQSCPVSGHHHHHYHHQPHHNHNHHLNHRGHVHHHHHQHPTIYRPIIKEKITRVDMVPAPEIDQNILPPLDNCENDMDNHDDSNDSKHPNRIKQQASMVQQLSEWKEKLSRELDVYQDILKQRHALRSSHSNSSSNANDSQPVRNPKKLTTGHRASFRSKTLKLATPKRLATAKQSHQMKKSDSFEDSLDDSWEETETSTTTDSTENNTNCSTPTGSAKPTTVVDDEIRTDHKRVGNGGSNGNGKYRILMKKSSSQKQTSAKNPMNSLTMNGGGGGESGKRRSTSFNRKVKIVTQYEKILQAMESDKTWQKEIAFGRRIGLYRFRGDIGNGNFSQVKIAIHTLTKEQVAVKILDKSRLDIKTQRMLTREIRTMETLHHPNLIRIFEVIESYSKHFIVMELAPGGELFQVISTNGRFSESEAKFFFAQIISAIDHMHQHNLIHRDIKAENVFFSDPCTVKVGDFGFSTRITSKDELLSTFCGSPPYAAPELFRDESYRGPYVDYWALGVLLYFIITGMMPFRAQNIVALKKLILDCRYDIPGYVSVECCQLIAGFLQPEPLKRFTLEQARSTRWLGDQPISKSLPKYDLKSSYAKLIKQRAIVATTNTEAESKKLAFGSNPDHLDVKPESDQNTINQGIKTDSPKHLNKRHTVYADMQYSNAIINGDLKSTETCPPLNDDEKETFHQMMLLGIDEKILNSHVDKGSHSHIVGTFRILMHGVLRESNSRKRNILRNGETMENGNGFNPIRRSTSMNVAPLDRIWAHYAKKAQQQRQQGNLLLDGKSKTTNPSSTVKCPPRSAKLKKNETMMTKTSQSSYDSGKSSSLAAEVKTPSRLKKIFNGRSSASPEPTNISESNKCTTTTTTTTTTNSTIDAESKEAETDSAPVEELKIKEKIRKEDQSMVAKPKNNQQVQKQQSLNMPSIKDNNYKKNDPNSAAPNVGTQNGGNCVGGRLGRSFRTLKHLLTESNICGNNVQAVIQPQPSANPIKPHVIHKTTTLQIMPRNCQTLTNAQLLSSYAQPPSSTHPIWPLNSGVGGGGSKRKSKLWRSQTTPDVSLINGDGTAHHHLTLPCYCDQMLMMNQNVDDEATQSPAFRSNNKKSFNNVHNRCTIV